MSKLVLFSDEEVDSLEKAIKYSPVPYIRNRAYAVLQVGKGITREDAAKMLYTPVERHSVGNWVAAFQKEGIAGLKIKPGRGRRPGFSPLSEEEARLEIDQKLKSAPPNDASRWKLSSLLDTCKSILMITTLGGLFTILKRLKISYQRARAYVHSPDEFYEIKLTQIKEALKEAVQSDNEEVVALFEDELTVSIHPTIARDWGRQKDQPLAKRAIGSELTTRLVGAINPITGKVDVMQRSKVTVPSFVAFLDLLVKEYPNAKRIYLIIDNWPVHYHPSILACLEKQLFEHYFRTPKSWQNVQPEKKYIEKNLPIQFVPLPTYASWLNPIEKYWKLLKQNFIHNHKLASNFKELKELILEKNKELNLDKDALLSYCGLKKKNGIYYDSLFNNQSP